MKLKAIDRSYSLIGLIVLAYVAFISLGLPDGLLGVAWPSIRQDFSRSLESLGLMIFASTTGYLFSSFYSGHLITRLGIGWLLALSCALTGLGLIGYTFVPYWWMILLLAVGAGLGGGAIDAGINTFAAANYGERMMQWLHASFGIGITMGPFIMTMGITIYDSWRLGYLVVGTAQIILAVCFILTVPMWRKKDVVEDQSQGQLITDYKTTMGETLKQLRVWLSMLLFFLYAGIETALGSWAYTLLTGSRGINPETAGIWVGSYWATFTIGRILAGLYTKKVNINSIILISLFAALLGAFLLFWNPAATSNLIAVAVIGFAIAPVFPGMVSLTSRRVGPRYAANTIGMQISAAGLGVIVIPGLIGILAQRVSLEIIPISMIILTALMFGLYFISTGESWGKHSA